jgi:DNA-directed RNA polymerase subunit RPC12/RpoP
MSNVVKYWCRKCGQPTAEKQDDIQGWDGYCSNCGMIAQGHVGDAVEPDAHLKCEKCGEPSTHRIGGLNLCDEHDFRSQR